MPLLFRNVPFKTINYFVRLYRITRKSHYEVLNLKKDCSEKDIKQAFIKLSKQFHPDKNKDAKAQEQFVQIVEAYNVLSKPISRRKYDCTTEIPRNDAYNVYRNAHDQQYQQPPYTKYHYSYRETNNEHHSQEKDDSYYGFSGVEKMPNYVIIMLCVGFGLFGLAVQMWIIRESFYLHRRTLDEKSKQIGEEYEKVRSRALHNTNEMQTRLLLDKIVTGSNSTVATASLGQALANDKKDMSDSSASASDADYTCTVPRQQEQKKVIFKLSRRIF